MSTTERLKRKEPHAFWSGSEARRRGESIDSNPHWPRESDAWWAWRMGWSA